MSGQGANHRSMSEIRSLGTPQDDETVLWRGGPDWRALAVSAFHTPVIGAYFLLLSAIALAMGSTGGAVLTAAAGFGTLGLLYSLAWVAARTTTYILTDRRLIMNIGMAIEKSINLPLKKIGAAHMTTRTTDIGDIVLELATAHGLGYAMLWPHARPFRFSHPQPMLRSIPDVANVAQRLAAATAAHQKIARSAISGVDRTRPVPNGMKEALA